MARRPVDDIPAEVMRSVVFNEDALRNLTSFDEAIALTTAVLGEPVTDASQELGDGFALLDSDHKGRLANVPLLLMDWNFYDGDFGRKFVAVHIVARNPDGGISKYILNDGSTGICDTLAKYTMRTGKTGGLRVNNGLRESVYTYCEQCQSADKCALPETHKAQGKHKRAVTYYLDTSA